MRTVAIALWFAARSTSTDANTTASTGTDADTVRTMQAALAQSALTHHDPAAGWGAAIAAELVRRTILGADPLAELPHVLGHVPAEVVEPFATMLAPEWQPSAHDHPGNGSVWGCLAQAVWALRQGGSFHDVVTAAIDLGGDTDTVACVAGALAGARHGMQGIPSRWVTYLHGTLDTPEGTVRYDNASLQALANRLLGRMPRPLSAFDRTVGPQELLPGVWAADLSAAAATTDRGFAVLSLCRTGGALDTVPLRREVYLFDQDGPDANPSLHTAVTDAVLTIEAWRSEGNEVLVHCHGGRSRTTLVLKAYAMRQHGWSAEEAHRWILDTWPSYDPWNSTFAEFLRSGWAR
jgi:ADP-ribosyl-[dinitrogen reductase] hydrolase